MPPLVTPPSHWLKTAQKNCALYVSDRSEAMTQDEIIEMARQAGASPDGKLWLMYAEELEVFAKLVAAKATEEANARANASWELMCKKMVAFEREACAKVCDELPAPDEYSITDKSIWDVTCIDCAEAIRARGTHDTR